MCHGCCETSEESEAQVRELPKCRKLAGGKAQAGRWRPHPEYKVRYDLGRTQIPTPHQKQLNHPSYMKV